MKNIYGHCYKKIKIIENEMAIKALSPMKELYQVNITT